ncbi:hypothetical protein HY570_02730, partial [Candidatus Micrarchaeota archaeon]|nr:hypothetical protein [Candidatus Micrarchaeota archaeon]
MSRAIVFRAIDRETSPNPRKIDEIVRRIIAEPLKETISRGDLLERYVKAYDLSKAAQRAIQESRVVEREFLDIKRLGYLHVNPDGSIGGFVELSAEVDDTAYIG